MNIQQKTNTDGGHFFYEEGGKELAGMYYSKISDNQISIDHTEVDDSLAGKGVGKILLESTVAFARKNGLSITPICTYAKHVMDKNAETYKDVRA
ncbi:MAG: GNAT family N-acetyltransferase [Chitinophagaceae bacterium]